VDTIVITSKKPFSLDAVRERLSPFWQVENTADGNIVAFGPSSRAYFITELSEAGSHYELLLNYSDVQFTKELLVLIADDAEVLIDNDFGLVLPGNEYVARIRSDKNWDWRREFLQKSET
jgi:hypothetical protein